MSFESHPAEHRSRHKSNDTIALSTPRCQELTSPECCGCAECTLHSTRLVPSIPGSSHLPWTHTPALCFGLDSRDMLPLPFSPLSAVTFTTYLFLVICLADSELVFSTYIYLLSTILFPQSSCHYSGQWLKYALFTIYLLLYLLY